MHVRRRQVNAPAVHVRTLIVEAIRHGTHDTPVDDVWVKISRIESRSCLIHSLSLRVLAHGQLLPPERHF